MRDDYRVDALHYLFFGFGQLYGRVSHLGVERSSKALVASFFRKHRVYEEGCLIIDYPSRGAAQLLIGDPFLHRAFLRRV